MATLYTVAGQDYGGEKPPTTFSQDPVQTVYATKYSQGMPQVYANATHHYENTYTNSPYGNVYNPPFQGKSRAVSYVESTQPSYARQTYPTYIEAPSQQYTATPHPCVSTASYYAQPTPSMTQLPTPYTQKLPNLSYPPAGPQYVEAVPSAEVSTPPLETPYFLDPATGQVYVAYQPKPSMQHHLLGRCKNRKRCLAYYLCESCVWFCTLVVYETWNVINGISQCVYNGFYEEEVLQQNVSSSHSQSADASET